MEEAPENGKESSHSARANGMNECCCCCCYIVLIAPYVQYVRRVSWAFSNL